MNTNYKKPLEHYLKMEPDNFKSRLINPKTGDILVWDNPNKQWVPRVNAG